MCVITEEDMIFSSLTYKEFMKQFTSELNNKSYSITKIVTDGCGQADFNCMSVYQMLSGDTCLVLSCEEKVITVWKTNDDYYIHCADMPVGLYYAVDEYEFKALFDRSFESYLEEVSKIFEGLSKHFETLPGFDPGLYYFYKEETVSGELPIFVRATYPNRKKLCTYSLHASQFTVLFLYDRNPGEKDTEIFHYRFEPSSIGVPDFMENTADPQWYGHVNSYIEDFWA